MIRSISLQPARLVLPALLCAFLVGCASPGIIEEPRELEDFDETREFDRVWTARVRGESPSDRLGLRPATDGDRVYLAGANGRVEARSVSDGRRVWRTQLDAPLSAGPTVHEGRLILGDQDGYLHLLDAEDGERRWESDVGAELLTPPAMTSSVAVVRKADGSVEGISLDDGSSLWDRDTEVPVLIVRGNTAPIVRDGRALVGFDDGHLRVFRVRDGQNQWTEQVGVAAGRTEVEELADVARWIDASSDVVFVGTAADTTAAIDIRNGNRLWERELGSFSGLSIDQDLVYLVDENSELHALNKQDGRSVWEADELRARDVTAPAVQGREVVVGDLEGYVHAYDADSGDLVGRERVSRARLYVPPLVVDDRVIVQDSRGRVRAYRLEEVD